MDNEIMLSICVPVFNHEGYIERALDSIMMQKTQYRYEVLIGEDCSTDNTREVLRKIENKYPENFHFFYRETNMSKSKYKNSTDLRMRSKGKYLIMLEGDDFWIDENKIEKQICFLEKNPEYIAVAHNCIVVNMNAQPLDTEYPECHDEEYTFKHFASEIMPGQTATLMFKNMYMDPSYDLSLLLKGLVPGDRLIYFLLLTYGKIHCIQEKMSAYRYVTSEGSSFSATYKYDFSKAEKWHEELLSYSHSRNNEEAIQIAEQLYFRNIGFALKNKAISFSKFIKLFLKSNNRFINVIRYIKGKINRKIFKKELWY